MHMPAELFRGNSDILRFHRDIFSTCHARMLQIFERAV
jgi:hypothetical protein